MKWSYLTLTKDVARALRSVECGGCYVSSVFLNF